MNLRLNFIKQDIKQCRSSIASHLTKLRNTITKKCVTIKFAFNNADGISNHKRNTLCMGKVSDRLRQKYKSFFGYQLDKKNYF